MNGTVHPFSAELLSKFRLARVHDADELESGAYWPQLLPYFNKPYFRRLTYALVGSGPSDRGRPGEVLSTRGSTGLGVFDVAYIADRRATAMSIAETGTPDYCIMFIGRGALEYRGSNTADPLDIDVAGSLIYRGVPGTRVCTTDDNERLSIWIPAGALERRLAALLGKPGREALVFVPRLDWTTAPGRAVRRLIRLLMDELASPDSFATNALARQSFEDLLIYSLLQCAAHNYTDRLALTASSPAPRAVRRAEDFIRSRAGQPIALHEVAEAVGCSVRALQLGFRQFRDTTPGAAIRNARLDAVRQAFARGTAGGTVTDIAHQYGFTNRGRFTQLYKARFGVSPADAVRGHLPLRAG
jgi:AraC-like DNA-binding protein